MKVIEMVAEQLRLNGFSGLFNDECCCRLSDLAPCCEIGLDCRAGYVQTHSKVPGLFAVTVSKDSLDDDAIEFGNEDW